MDLENSTLHAPGHMTHAIKMVCFVEQGSNAVHRTIIMHQLVWIKCVMMIWELDRNAVVHICLLDADGHLDGLHLYEAADLHCELWHELQSLTGSREPGFTQGIKGSSPMRPA